MADVQPSENSPQSGDVNYTRRSSKIISIKSTPDGDIQTVEETTTSPDNDNPSVKAFTSQLRESWDEVVDECLNDNNDGALRTSRHKQNLSMQFLDISISGDVDEAALEPPKQQERPAEKETIEGSAAYYFNRRPSTEVKQEDNDDENEAQDNDKNSFTQNIRSSWEDLGPMGLVKGGAADGNSASCSHKPSPSVQFLDSTVLEFSAEDLPQDVESSLEEQQPLSDVVNPPAAFEPPVPKAGLSPIYSPGVSSEEEQNSSAVTSEGEGIDNIGAPPFQPRLGADSPISPRSENDIVVPIPLRPVATAALGGVSRKHRRVFSGRSNPAMAHRRVNTRGDKSATREFRPEGNLGEGNDEQPQRGGKKAFTGGAPPNVYDTQQPSPGTLAMPPPIPQQQAPTQPQPSYPNYYHGTPPPSYDPYNAYPTQSQAPYQYGTPPPPPVYYNASPQSDAGINYGGARASPVMSGYPPQPVQPQQQYRQFQQYPSSAPGGQHPGGQAPPGRSDSNASNSSGGPYPPNNLAQPNLEHRVSGYAGEMPMARGTSIAGQNSNSNNDGGNAGGPHRREPSFNPLPFKEDGKGSHHRKQSSLGSFLATTNIFDEADIFVEDEGYASAPEEGDTDNHSRHVSSMSFARSLSSDNFLRQISDEQRNEEQSWQQPQQLTRPQFQPQPSPPFGPTPPEGYPPRQASPVVSGVGNVPTPPGSVVGSAPGYPPTPPGYYQYHGTPPQQGWYPSPHQGTPPQHLGPPSMPSPMPQGMQYHQGLPSMQPPPQQMMQSGPPPRNNAPPSAPVPPSNVHDQNSQASKSRRKCSHPGCPNRVVQGGLCISHGANRKKCSHPGCNKNVKKAGLCSTHGPARKRCEAEGCTKVAVQGGRCIAHGAKKKVCAMENCQKQSIMQGYCKRHYDEVNGVVKVRGGKKAAAKAAAQEKGGGHQRGLSLFQEDDLMQAIVNNGSPGAAGEDGLRGLSIE